MFKTARVRSHHLASSMKVSMEIFLYVNCKNEVIPSYPLHPKAEGIKLQISAIVNRFLRYVKLKIANTSAWIASIEVTKVKFVKKNVLANPSSFSFPA